MNDRPTALLHAGASIHRIASAELLDRLSYFSLQPQRILDLGAGQHGVASELAARFEQSRIIAVDPSIASFPPSSFAGWFRRRVAWPIRAQLRALPLQDGCADLALGHLLLPGHPAPDQVLREIARVLRPGGLLLFSTLGPASQLEPATTQFANSSPLAALPDLPDWGQLLMGSGFAEPVMDVEHHRVTYPIAAALQADLLGLRIDAASSQNEVTYELITGAAFAGTRQPAPADRAGSNEIAIPVASIRRKRH